MLYPSDHPNTRSTTYGQSVPTAPDAVLVLIPPGYDVVLRALVAELFGPVGSSAVARGDEDWKSVLRIADWHRLSTVLARHLAADPSVPGPVADRLGASVLHDTARSLLLDRHRREVLGRLQGHGIPAMVLKGSALVETVFPEPGSRDMGDIDILVPASRHAEAVRRLCASGYRPHEPEARAPGAPAQRHDAKLVSSDGLVPIELHRHLVDDVDHRRFDIGEVWERGRPSSAGEHLLPAPHDLLIHVCLHFVAGRAVRSEGALGQVRDIAWIAHRGGVDWAQLEAVSRRYGVAERVQLALAVAAQLGLLPARAQRAVDTVRTRRFVATRVLTHRAHVPVGSWVAGRAGLRDALWWSRMHLGDLPAGALPDRRAELAAAVIGRAAACRRVGRELAGDPRGAATDLVVGRWLRSLDAGRSARSAAQRR
jgi:hypothetical protein